MATTTMTTAKTKCNGVNLLDLMKEKNIEKRINDLKQFGKATIMCADELDEFISVTKKRNDFEEKQRQIIKNIQKHYSYIIPVIKNLNEAEIETSYISNSNNFDVKEISQDKPKKVTTTSTSVLSSSNGNGNSVTVNTNVIINERNKKIIRKCASVNKYGETIQTFDSVRQASELCKVKLYNVYSCCQGKTKLTHSTDGGSYRFAYV